MAGPYLELKFALEAQNPYVARVAVPYQPVFLEPTAEPTSQPKVRVDILGANISPEGNELNVIGNVTNLTDKAIVVSPQNTSLKGVDGALSPLNGSLPGFTWEINPGATLTFKLSFAKPAQLPATFSLLDTSVLVAPN